MKEDESPSGAIPAEQAVSKRGPDKNRRQTPRFVIPAEAGIQGW